ncbi:MAG: DUF447 family protein [Planctomycetales bacterium]|nr:DUF447 family protein [Planctomycetales bacterium]
MILEGLVTTKNADGSTNVSPMGPVVEATMQSFVLRPFQTSRTYQNLVREGYGIFHVTDNVLQLAQAAVGQPSAPNWLSHDEFPMQILQDACRWYAFTIRSIDASETRSEIHCCVTRHGFLREFMGFNRAKHAVLEAAILATRIHLIPQDELFQQLDQLAILVAKTGGKDESQAFQFLVEYVKSSSE